MDVYINHRQVEFKPESSLTWHDFFAALLKDGVLANHGIVRVSVDGQDGMPFMTEQSSQPLPPTVKVVEIHTKDISNISHDGLLKAESLIHSLKTEMVKTSDLFRGGDLEAGGKRLIAVMEAVKPLIQFVHSLGMSYSMDFEQIRLASGQTLRERVEGFIGSMKEIIETQERKDYVALADFLEYQMPEDLESWQQILAVLQKEIEKADRASH